MNVRKSAGIALAVMTLLLVAQPAAAHRIRIWAMVMESGTIRGEVFSPGAKLADVAVQIFANQSDALLATVTTDEKGQFEYRPTSRQDHRLKVDLGDGHVSQTIIAAEDLHMIDAATVGDTDLPMAPDARQYEEQIFQLRRQLEANHEHIGLRDVFAGLGYIVGAVGLVALIKQRRRGARAEENSAGD